MAMQPNKRFLIMLGVVGIVIELIAVALLAAKMISGAVGIPVIIAAMFLALIPMFALSRMHRKR